MIPATTLGRWCGEQLGGADPLQPPRRLPLAPPTALPGRLGQRPRPQPGWTARVGDGRGRWPWRLPLPTERPGQPTGLRAGAGPGAGGGVPAPPGQSGRQRQPDAVGRLAEPGPAGSNHERLAGGDRRRLARQRAQGRRTRRPGDTSLRSGHTSRQQPNRRQPCRGRPTLPAAAVRQHPRPGADDAPLVGPDRLGRLGSGADRRRRPGQPAERRTAGDRRRRSHLQPLPKGGCQSVRRPQRPVADRRSGGPLRPAVEHRWPTQILRQRPGFSVAGALVGGNA